MATQAALGKSHDGSLPEQAGELRYVARQPILDQRSKVHGYELLLWNGRDPVPCEGSDPALHTMLDDSVIFGLEEMACGLPAFVNCSLELLSEEWLQVLPPKLTVLELQADVEPTASLLEACRRLKGRGFKLALKDFTGKPESKPLLELADYVKVNITKLGAAERSNVLRQLAGRAAQSIAENVETQEEYALVRQEGFKYFQGYYFCHPEPLKSHKIPGNRLVQLEILEALQKDPVDLERLSQLVKCDASLTYFLLRLLNSPVCAMRQEVTSIQTALLLLGITTFRRIAILAIASDFNTEQPTEILRMAFVRGRFCELAARLCGLVPSEQYIVGMASLFPAMLRVSIEDMIELLPLRPEARDALLGKGNPEGLLLNWLVSHEHGDWVASAEIVRSIGLHHDQIKRCHSEAVAWADAALKSNS